ncbi:G-type lectin S-receptor-like serine/threonine-protein kinase [Striga hermonthica]|uniref:Receptor-like serine/threonine-protein kinase n=1 Tax=Striga hermonthica TaxID=68872 RepID=A0A9N7MTG0_STRHE|nr:G-type lectin S-receptor-like serine/threonine-protein kinase [Striga hermonthica]
MKKLISFFLVLTTSLLLTTAISDTLDTSHILRDNGETLISSGDTFELGFFSPGNSTNRYIGIWYRNIPLQTVVWVANRANPIPQTSSATLTLFHGGLLLLLNHTNAALWSTNTSTPAHDPVARLLDSGNLVVVDRHNPDKYLWQSFDYPTDTLLPGMKLGWDSTSGLNRRISSWKGPDDPSPGELSFGVELDVQPQSILWRGTAKYYRAGPWNGMRFGGGPELRSNTVFRFRFASGPEEHYYTWWPVNKSVISRLVVNDTAGARQRYVWGQGSWRLYGSVPQDYCDGYGLCGPNGVCAIIDVPSCECLPGFEPRGGGCERGELAEGCNGKSDFVRFTDLKVPDTNSSWMNRNMSLVECREACVGNCSCTAYASRDIRDGGTGCILWFGDLYDIRRYSSGAQDLFIRIPSLDTGSGGRKREVLIVTISIAIGLLLLSLGIIYFCRKRKRPNRQLSQSRNKKLDLPLFDLSTLTKATDNFSSDNKLGEGGYGPVYKGLLDDGGEIAVKRLSTSSHQGVDEFMNEVICTAKLEHRNLVKLLGCCIHGDEYMLVYEYLTNKSLDLILFDPVKSMELDWPTRIKIINGIARGLMYLHQDSRLRIIHRDLKASNILLDSDMNPKISDFGLARAFGGNETGANTKRVVGTYGYMSPEYAVDGLFSVKSDVFSFGVLVLEIISGERNRGFSHRDHSLNLLGHAWMLYKEEKALELAGFGFEYRCYASNVLRSIQIGLLCVQESPEERPTMSSVVLMLSNETVLTRPKQPGFFTGRLTLEATHENSTSSKTPSSVNEMTITTFDGR